MACPVFLAAQVTIKHVAVTLDNMPVAGKEVNLMWTQGFNFAGAKALKEAKIPLVGFVNEKNVISPKEKDIRTAILGTWIDAGAELGNGTFSDIPIGKSAGVQWFEDDAMYGGRIIKELIRNYGDTLRYFRFPGMDLSAVSAQELTRVGSFLKNRGYIPVTATIRFEDEYFNTPYINSKIERDTMLVRYIGERYLDYFKSTLDYYERLSQDNFSRQITHILSLRCSEINNDFFGYLMYILWQKGYRFVTLEEALADPLYKKHLPEPYKGGFFWDYATGVSKSNPVQPQQMIKALYNYQTY